MRSNAKNTSSNFGQECSGGPRQEEEAQKTTVREATVMEEDLWSRWRPQLSRKGSAEWDISHFSSRIRGQRKAKLSSAMAKIKPKHFTAKVAKIAKTGQVSSGQLNLRTEIFRAVQPGISAIAV